MVEMIFFSSPIGLGHVTRDFAIAEHLQNISKKYVTGNGAAIYLKEVGCEVDNAYVPPQFVVKEGSLQKPLKWLWKYYQYYKQCKNISSKVIKKENPEFIVSDEDFASLSVAQEHELPTVLITDILETKFTKGLGSIIEKKMNRSMKNIIKKCNMVILPENGIDEGNIRRVGPIVRSIKSSREELRKKFSFNKKTIVVSVGGTDAGKFLIKKTLKSKAIQENDIKLVIVSGPTLKNNYSENIMNLGFVNNLHEIIFASDLVISLAGKSTIDESKSYGTPGIFIPIKNHFEQEDNAREEGFSYDDVNRLDSLILEKLREKRNPQSYDGALKAAKLIENIIKK
jgi:UDP-N-acetylglucosamine--N-acetylmuramyl-(pentapeptide) pyrophosphoryl-undecaprenol N-acetylglucosamine transferase